MITKSEAILAVSDVRETVRFYRDVLGFQGEWFWEDPPTFGGVQSGNVHVMFCLQPQMKGKTEGHQHSFRVDDVDAMLDRHRSAGAAIISPVENKPWGLREYTVRDPNGYHLRFGGPIKYERPSGAADALPGYIRIIPRVATVEEYHALIEAVGWDNKQPDKSPEALANTRIGIVAVDTRSNATIGMMRVCGDGKFFTIWDVIVAKDYQCQRIGSNMMETALAELRKVARPGAFIGLFTGKPKFYERLGFADGGGMQRGL